MIVLVLPSYTPQAGFRPQYNFMFFADVLCIIVNCLSEIYFLFFGDLLIIICELLDESD